jgi:CDP-paratose 2-epimerase
MRILVTGGAGFVGGSISVALAERISGARVVAADNLRRRGSELNLPRLAAAGVTFAHADVRNPADLEVLGPVDLIVECSAEPSALAGVDGRMDYLYATNTDGAYHCLELARRHDAALIFLSTSRVYPIAALRSLSTIEEPTRLAIGDDQAVPGASPLGIAEDFPLAGARTLYGATKLAAELLVTEYVEAFGLRALVLRCGVIAGPWQMGRVDQGVFTYWLLAHRFGVPLRYLGFGGTGKQVRDILHVDDLVDLIISEISDPSRWDGAPLNIGGGLAGSLSLVELTDLCSSISGQATRVTGAPDEPRPGDVPVYITDHTRLTEATGWTPSRTPSHVLEDIWTWASVRQEQLRALLFE